MKHRIKISKWSETERAVGFRCPGCGDLHVVPFEGAGAWQWNGDLEKPTLSPSLLAEGTKPITKEEADRIMAGEKIAPIPYVCHSFIKVGRIQFLGDCTHKLAGQTVDLMEISQ